MEIQTIKSSQIQLTKDEVVQLITPLISKEEYPKGFTLIYASILIDPQDGELKSLNFSVTSK